MTRLTVAVIAPRGFSAGRGLGAWLSAAAPHSARGTVTIAIVSDRVMARLNGQFRQKPEPTDVLSFPASEPGAPGPARTAAVRPKKISNSNKVIDLGDIAIARGVATRQARAEGHPVRTELRVLALHGLLHLLGYDHERDKGQMRALEDRLRRRAGLPGGLVARASRSSRRR